MTAPASTLTLAGPTALADNVTLTKNGLGLLELTGGLTAGDAASLSIEEGVLALKGATVDAPAIRILTGAEATLAIHGRHAVGTIEGNGTTALAPLADLTVTHVRQDTLIVGAGATVTIRPVAGDSAAGVPEPGTIVLLGMAGTCLLARWAYSLTRRRQRPAPPASRIRIPKGAIR
jgi:hypothetical protein